MKDLKKPLRAFAFLSLGELAVFLVAGTVAWAIAKHDLAALDRPFYQGAGTELYAKVVIGLMLAITIINVIGIISIMSKGESVIALAAGCMTLAMASLIFLPMRFTVYGLGGVLGAALAVFLLIKLLRAVTWPFRWIVRKLRRKAPASAEAPAQPKTGKPSKRPAGP